MAVKSIKQVDIGARSAARILAMADDDAFIAEQYFERYDQEDLVRTVTSQALALNSITKGSIPNPLTSDLIL